MAASFTQNAAAEAALGRKFSIGYLPEGSDVTHATARMEALRQFLLANAGTAATLAAAGYAEIVLSPCDGPRDMGQRMIDGEFDLVFATAMVYAQQNGPGYEPILQFKKPGDFQQPRREAGVFRQGIIFVGPRSALFTQSAKPTREELGRLLGRTPLAVPSADSAAGYLTPRYIMAHDLKLATIPAPLFCGSDSEVVKHVVSGLLEVGACSEGALAELLPGDQAKYTRVLWKTDPVPTDPILVRRELVPASSPLGIRLKMALKEFFRKPELSVANASPRDFETIVDYLEELQGTRETSVTAPPTPATMPAPTPRPTLAVTPTPTPTPAPRPEPALPQALPALTPSPAVTPVSLASPVLPPGEFSRPRPRAAAKPLPEMKPVLPVAVTPTPGPPMEKRREPSHPASPPLRPAPRSTPKPPPLRPVLPETFGGDAPVADERSAS